MAKFNDLTGQTFENLKVLRQIESDGNGNARWQCECKCGNGKAVRGCELRNKSVRSCGCIRKEQRPHYDKNASILRNRFEGMIKRCYDTNRPEYKHWGAKGVRVCDEWLNSFDAFYRWSLQNGFSDELTIERNDNYGDYCPENCTWTTRKSQARNRSNNRNIDYDGKTQCIGAWAEEFGINYQVLYQRIMREWDIESALLTPTRSKLNA